MKKTLTEPTVPGNSCAQNFRGSHGLRGGVDPMPSPTQKKIMRAPSHDPEKIIGATPRMIFFGPSIFSSESLHNKNCLAASHGRNPPDMIFSSFDFGGNHARGAPMFFWGGARMIFGSFDFCREVRPGAAVRHGEGSCDWFCSSHAPLRSSGRFSNALH